ncbi:MAG TPA: serine--tRNA ligase [Bacteroidia bacterium]|nr:serine--tRNA ligase [Bacteroidia bacterium]MBP7714029.1 serine--tRNA ligase [Bacteroidia bacterium]MBP8667698.1 serine--tRNA ligase [Bacteroidia bacterium]HQW17080.1 serine--tRNA ligase [Bacteroidia bacterium]HQW48481.1 serine--tRNA ligase [Bacteroidia bacterium]
MLELSKIRENPDNIIKNLAIKNFSASEIVALILQLDEKRRQLQKENDACLAQQNKMASEIGIAMKAGKKDDAEQLKEKNAVLKETSKKLQAELETTENLLQDELVKLPNIPSEKVSPGKSAADNDIVFTVTGLPKLTAKIPHWELCTKYDLIDFETGVKLTGAGFPVYSGKGARLQRALINFFLDKAVAAGYLEVQPPILVNQDSGFGTGQLPDKEGQMYFVTEDQFYLIPTAEVPITNIYRNTILKESDFPQKLTAYTPCFRREAGSYGKDVRGLNRLHQFDKVEIVRIEHPDNSYKVLEEMKDYVCSLLEQLELPYRVLKLCGGDMSFASALTYDLEVFSAAQEKWLEVSSVSNFESFQSNRLKLRFKGNDGKTQLTHTLNGSALALPRIVAALLENNYNGQYIHIPKAIQHYTGFDRID